MRDSELAVRIVGGDPGALAEAYDKYAGLLWSYCGSMLSDADHAAEAVLDTFVIAASRLEVLRAVGRLRAWLYAVARSECLRRLRSSGVSAAVDETPRLRQAAAVLSTGEQRQLRAVLRAAFGGLEETERDVMTMVWYGLDVAEVAVVLGVSRSDAYTLFTRARDQLEESVGVLLVGWSGRVDCAELDAMLTGHDRRLTAELRGRLMRHVGKCGVCAERYHAEMRPALLLGLSMGALLAEASQARALTGTAPAGLWEEVYRMTNDKGPEAVWRRAMGGRRVAFGEDGFPKALAARDGMLTAPRLAVAAVGTMAVAATATGLVATGHHVAVGSGGGPSTPITAVMPDAASSANVTIGPSAHATGAPATGKHAKAVMLRPGNGASQSGSPSALPASGGTSVPVSRGSGSASPASSSSYAAASSSARATGGSTTASASASPATSPSGSAGSTGSSPSSSPSSPSSGSGSPAAAGTLSVSTTNIALAVGSGSSFTLSAHGGTVDWSISVPSGLLGGISLSQTSGTLAAGQSVTIIVQASGIATVGTPLTISPGGETVTVDISLL